MALAALILALPCSTQAQWDLFYDGNIPVTESGNTLDLGFAGGLNFVQVSPIDLNGDGLDDLFLFDRSGNTFTTLINDGSGGPGAYRITRDYDRVWPLSELYGWALLRDYDCDGRADIFTYSQAGFAVYRNVSDGADLAFELITIQTRSDYISTGGTSVVTNLFVSQVDIPSIADMDGDGDLDIITFSLLGTYVEYHKNLSLETYGSCDSLKYEVRNRCWGFFSENFSTNSVALDAPCTFNVPNPEIGTGPGTDPEGTAKNDERTHSGSAVTSLDLNGDGVMDLLLGDIGFNNVVALYNGGTVDLAQIVEADTLFPSDDVPVDLALFPASFHLDIDGDGIRDLVVSPNAQSLAQNAQSMWYYRNTGTDDNPLFKLQQNDLFQDRMLDFGEGAYPVPFDHDGDGLMDLLVANGGYFQTNGPYLSKVALLRNTGTAIAPAFDLVTDDYMNLSTSGIGQAMYPAFGDLDGDGDQDMLVGDLQGGLHFFRNTATGPLAQFQLVQPNLPDATGSPLDVGQYATPQLVDLDGDGLLDLIIGERNGNLNHYRNTGTTAVPVWTLVSEVLGGVNTSEWWNITGHSVPFLFNNADGEREMLLGSEVGWLYHYGDIDNNLDGTWTLLDSTFLGVREGMRTGLCLNDFTGDGVLDLIIGNYRGGLTFWRSDEVSGVGLNQLATSRDFSMQPNPTSDQVELVLSQMPLPGSFWTLRNSLGQEVLKLRAEHERTWVPTQGLPPGMYLVRLEGGSTSAAQRLVVLRNTR
ncbi:MAG: FG-GAP-like repeat-containing protein [Flavobacteriales bacterium]